MAVRWPCDGRPAGCQTKIELVERLLRGTPAWEPFLELTRGERGREAGHAASNPAGVNQHTKEEERLNRHEVTVKPDAPEPPPRDYSREAPTGNSVSYALRRLKKNRPDRRQTRPRRARTRTPPASANTAPRPNGPL
jgi:hypothetical protein